MKVRETDGQINRQTDKEYAQKYEREREREEEEEGGGCKITVIISCFPNNF